MTTRRVTITSKNQLTLPADLVRKYKLDQNRVMEVREHAGTIELRPVPTLEDRMKKHWATFNKYAIPISKPTAAKIEQQIHSEADDAYAEYFNETKNKGDK